MSKTPGESLNPISEADARRAFYDTSLVLTRENGLDLNERLAELVGGAESYNALIGASEEFITRHPRIYEHRAPSPFVTGLWMGMLAGAHAVQEANKR